VYNYTITCGGVIEMNLLTKNEVAEVLKCHVKTIKYYVTTRQIPFILIGRVAMFRLESIEKWVDAKEQKHVAWT
jgi:excisionase family DNA binding protein